MDRRQTSPTLGALAPELICIISDSLDDHDFLTLRSVSRTFQATLHTTFDARFIKQRFLSLVCKSSLAALHSLANSRWGQNVEELVIDDDHLALHTIDEYFSELESQRELRMLRSYVMDQEHYWRVGESVRLLTEALKAMPNCSSIVITRPTYTRSKEFWQRKIFDREYSTPSGLGILTAAWESIWTNPVLSLCEDSLTAESATSVTSKSMRALVDADIKVTSLEIIICDHGPASLYIPSQDLLQYRAFLSRVKVFTFRHIQTNIRGHGRKDQWDSVLARFMQCMDGVESLTIQGPSELNVYAEPAGPDLLLAIQSWPLPRMRSLSLSEFYAKDFKALTAALLNHGQLLEEVEIGPARFKDALPSTEDILDLVRLCPNAEKFRISELRWGFESPSKEVMFASSLPSMPGHPGTELNDHVELNATELRAAGFKADFEVVHIEVEGGTESLGSESSNEGDRDE